nr:TetR family transcriptional regulator C-terminal domain-containing protein [Paenibacillus caui]
MIEAQVDEWIERWAAKEHQYRTVAEKLYGLADHTADDLQNPLIKAAEEFSGSQTADPAVAEQILNAMNKQRDIFQQVLREGIASGEIQGGTEQQLTLILFALIAGLGAVRYELELDELRPLHRTAISIFLNGVTTKRNI